LINNTNNYPPI